MKNINNKYSQPIHNPDRSSRRVPQSVQETPITSWDCENNVKSSVSHSRNWRWSESPEIELEIKNKDTNLETRKNTEKTVSYSMQRNSSSIDTKSLNQKSHSPNKRKTSSNSWNTECDRASSKQRSIIIDPSPHKSETKSFIFDSKHSKCKKSTDQKNEKSSKHSPQRRENYHGKLNNSDLRSYKKLKKSRSKSPSSRKKHKKSKK